MYDVLIIGAGTAGMSAAIYVQRAGKSALVLEAKSYGGQIVNTPEVENYPGIASVSGFDFATGLYEQAVKCGAEIKMQGVLELVKTENGFLAKTRRKEYEAKAVIIACGASNRPLGLDGEQELTGHGVSYCATCDGAFFKGKKVVVVGGGNTALEDAAFLSNYCEKVYLLHRRDQFRGDHSNVEKLRAKENVEFVLNSLSQELLTEEDERGEKKVCGLRVKDKNTLEERILDVSGVFVAIGQIPKTEVFKDLVELDESGYIVAGEDCRTKVSGLFAAGDCRTKKVRQLTTAASDGAVAALAACEYINE